MLEQLFDLFAPHLCTKCHKEADLLCLECAQFLPFVSPACYKCTNPADDRGICDGCISLSPFAAMYAATSYGPDVKEVVRRLKYERAQAAVYPMARLMSHRLPSFPSSTVVTCAPTATRRVRIRGYDQAELLAKALADTLRLPYRSMLMRVGQTRQVGSSREQRQKQLQHAFSAKVKMPSSISQVILIDDVLTTGATLEAAAATLKQHGVEKVIAVVFAKA